MRALWLPDILRDDGLDVEVYPEWETRGRPFLSFEGVVGHHTGAGGREALRRLIAEGRSDLPGPLSQLFLDDKGKFTVIASGKSNHAGPGRWQGVTSGNSRLIGIEAMNAGTKDDVWEPAQYDAYLRGGAAILTYIKKDAVMFVGHKEWALPKGRKIDPTFDMFKAREGIDLIMKNGVLRPSTEIPPVTTDPVMVMLKKGSMGNSVRKLQRLLGITADGNFGPKTEAAVIKFQKSKGLVQDGKVGPKTWKALGVR